MYVYLYLHPSLDLDLDWIWRKRGIYLVHKIVETGNFKIFRVGCQAENHRRINVAA